nr:hypothetical protein Iba_chr12bCG13400 [Ipomoea batatas]
MMRRNVASILSGRICERDGVTNCQSSVPIGFTWLALPMAAKQPNMSSLFAAHVTHVSKCNNLDERVDNHFALGRLSISSDMTDDDFPVPMGGLSESLWFFGWEGEEREREEAAFNKLINRNS